MVLPELRGSGRPQDPGGGPGAQTPKDSVVPALTSRGRRTTTWCLRIRSHLEALVVGRVNLCTSAVRTGPSLSSCHQHQPPAQTPPETQQEPLWPFGAAGASDHGEDWQHFPAEPGSQRLPGLPGFRRWTVRALPPPPGTLFSTNKAPAERRTGSQEGQARSRVPTTLPPAPFAQSWAPLSTGASPPSIWARAWVERWGAMQGVAGGSLPPNCLHEQDTVGACSPGGLRPSRGTRDRQCPHQGAEPPQDPPEAAPSPGTTVLPGVWLRPGREH